MAVFLSCLQEGKIAALLGSSGVGKATLINWLRSERGIKKWNTLRRKVFVKGKIKKSIVMDM